MAEAEGYPDGATVTAGGLLWRYDANRRMWDGRRTGDGPVVKRRRQGSAASDKLWFRHRHGMSVREYVRGRKSDGC